VVLEDRPEQVARVPEPDREKALPGLLKHRRLVAAPTDQEPLVGPKVLEDALEAPQHAHVRRGRARLDLDAEPGRPEPHRAAARQDVHPAVDEQVGRLLESLDDSGRAGDTIVLFTSDHGDTALDWHAFHRPAVEPEFVLTIGRDLADEVGDEAALVEAIDCVSPGIEVHNYHFWMGEPTSQELIASNGIHAALVVGERKLRPQGLDWDMEGVGVWLNDDLAASGIGAEIMGGPLRSLRWLVNHLVRRGEALRAGQLVIPGSPVGLVSVEPGDRVMVRFTHVGRVQAEFRGDR